MAFNSSSVPTGAYTGVRAPTPPNMRVSNVDPTTKDSNGMLPGWFWLNNSAVPPTAPKLWFFSKLDNGLAIWILIEVVSATGEIKEVIADAGIPILPTANGEIFAFGGLNINTFGGVNTLTVNLNDSIFLPETTADKLAGVIGIGNDTALSMFGPGNIFLGNAGNFTTAGLNNVGTGDASLGSLTDGINNAAYGVASGQDLLGGSNNLLLGFAAGSAYTGSESSNILLENIGVIGESNTMRLGLSGSGDRQVNNVFMGGVFASTNTLNADNGVMIVDTNDVVKMTRGTDGEFLTSKTGTGPLWKPLTSTGNTIAVTYDGGTGSVNLEAVSTTAAVTCAFLAQNTPNVPNVTGDGTAYTYGTTQALVERFDVGNNFNPATGVFTAPIESQYYLEITVDLTNTDADSGNDVELCTAQIITTARTYTWNFGGSSYMSAGGVISGGTISFQQIVDMDAGDTATFTISTDMSAGGGNKVIGLGEGAYVSGYLVSGAGVGILEVDADAGTAIPMAGVLQIVGGTNCTTVGGGNTITINATGGGGGGFVTWSVINASQAGVAGEGYFCNGGAPVVVTLPAVAAVGDTIAVAAMNANGFQIAQTAGVSVRFTNALTTVGVGGSLASTSIGDAVVLVCNVANTGWFAVPGSMGNITIV